VIAPRVNDGAKIGGDMELPTLKYVDLSTAHITGEDAKLLGDPDVRDAAGLAVYENEYGFFIPVPPVGDYFTGRADGFSEEFCNLVQFCQEQDIELIRLDRDAQVVVGLPTFDW
jgi:hypothetical protein